MKRVILLIIGIILVILLVIQKHPSYFKDLYSQISNRLMEQSWEFEGKYNIDETEWFDNGQEIFSGSRSYAQLGNETATCLNIKAVGCRVEILCAEEEYCHFEFTNMKKIQAYQTDGTLIVNAMRDTKWEQENKSSVLKIYVPEEFEFNRVEMELGVGAIHIEKIVADVVDISVEAGKLVVQNVCANKMNVDLGAGDIQLKSAVLGNTQIDCAAGNVELTIKGLPADFNYKLQCVAGNIQIGDEKYSGINEEKEIGNMALKTMDLECAVGNILINYEP